MKPHWQRRQEQQRIRRQQEQMRRLQERMRRQQEMGAAWLEQQRRRQLEEERSYAVGEGPSCIGRMARAFLYVLPIAIVLFFAFACLIVFLRSSF
jgi:uncharacterized membrane protein (DUF106 family)